MTTFVSGIGRRAVLAAGTAVAALPLAAPHVRAQGAPIRLGVLHPVTGALSFSGQQGRIGAEMAIADINAAGGIKAMGGARLEAVLGDARSNPEGGVAEVERMAGANVAAIIGGFASGIVLATTQAASRYDLPYLVDVGVADGIVTRGLRHTFRFGPGFGVISRVAMENLVAMNDAAGKPARTVIIIHEDSLFGSGLAGLLNRELPARGFEVLETIPHPTPTRDFSNVALRIRSRNPDLVIPASYYNEYVLLARTMQQQRVRPKAIFSVLGGAASNFRFVREFPDAARFIMDCNHWVDGRNPAAQDLRRRVEAANQWYTYELFLNYANVMLLADALERAGSAAKERLTDSLAASPISGHFMPYGPTKFENGQNTGAVPVVTQVQDNDIKVIFPAAVAEARPVFPVPA